MFEIGVDVSGTTLRTCYIGQFFELNLKGGNATNLLQTPLAEAQESVQAASLGTTLRPGKQVRFRVPEIWEWEALTTVPPPASHNTKHSPGCRKLARRLKELSAEAHLQKFSAELLFQISRSVDGCCLWFSHHDDVSEVWKRQFIESGVAHRSESGIFCPIRPVLPGRLAITTAIEGTPKPYNWHCKNNVDGK